MTKYELVEEMLHDCSAVGGGLIRQDKTHTTFDRFEALTLRDTLKRNAKLVSFRAINNDL
tara:strand:- start:1012 stop:1191 length:180 start_codon:yes stop_codon:yes gene_type:complete